MQHVSTSVSEHKPLTLAPWSLRSEFWTSVDPSYLLRSHLQYGSLRAWQAVAQHCSAGGRGRPCCQCESCSGKALHVSTLVNPNIT